MVINIYCVIYHNTYAPGVALVSQPQRHKLIPAV